MRQFNQLNNFVFKNSLVQRDNMKIIIHIEFNLNFFNIL